MKHFENKTKKLLSIFTFAFFISTLPVSAQSTAEQTSRDFTQVAKKAIPAVVSIKVKGTAGKGLDSDDFFGDDFLQQFFFGMPRRSQERERIVSGQASGFLISSDGYLITNSHVVKDASEILVALNDGREFPGKVIGQDPSTDIALVKIEAVDLPYLELGNASDLEIGQWAIAIGNPFGLQASLTVGVISAKGRNNLDLANVEDFIQTDAAINRGNSGGPLLNLDGEVIGMNTAIVTSSGGYVGVGFAIPSNMIKQVIDQIKTNGTVTRGFLGIVLQAVDQDLASAFGVKEARGALIAEVSPGSPAADAGLKQGDIVIEYNKHSVRTIGELRNAISMMAPGSELTLTVVREGKSMEIPVKVGKFADGKLQAGSIKGNQLGFEVQTLTPEVARSLGIQEQNGVVITRVETGSPAAWAGLKKGLVILAVNQQKVSNVEQFDSILGQSSKDKPILFLIRQGDAIRFLSMKVG